MLRNDGFHTENSCRKMNKRERLHEIIETINDKIRYYEIGECYQVTVKS